MFDPDVVVFRWRVWKLLPGRKVGILILVVVLDDEEVDVTFLLPRPDIAWKHCVLASLPVSYTHLTLPTNREV